MRTLRARLLLALVLVAVAAGTVAGAGEGRPLRLDERLSSHALAGRVRTLVVLPPGYWRSTRRYPVVYFLHGLPAGPASYRSSAWLAGALRSAGPAILVEPQGARDGDSDAEYLDWGCGRNWQTFVTRELTAYVDSYFRTIPSRAGRAIVGLSAGGYGAVAAGLTHLDRFSVIESWSGYFEPTNPAGTAPIAGGPHSNAHRLTGLLARDESRRPTFVAFYVGRGDSRFRTDNERFDGELAAAGVPHVFAQYPGGHATALWQRHATAWLRLALAHLAAPARAG
jgi:enterochelin esterase-like enzyme